MSKIWLVLLVVAHDPSAAPVPEVTVGPFPTMQTCYAAAALGVDRAFKDHPDDYRVVCLDDTELLRLPELVKRGTGQP